MASNDASTTPRRPTGTRPLAALLLLALAGALHAAPPASRDFLDADELLQRIAERTAEIRRARKPRRERMLLALQEGAEEFEGRKLTGALVVRELTDWVAFRRAQPSEQARRIASLLPGALARRYGVTRYGVSAEERARVAGPLVGLLTHRYAHVRQLAIDALAAMYGTRYGYEPDARRHELYRKQRKWKRKIGR